MIGARERRAFPVNPLIHYIMEPIIKEKETVYVDGYGGGRYGGGNHQAKSNWALGLGILGSVTGVTALARQGGIGGIFGGGGAAGPVTYNYGGPAVCPSNVLVKECDDILNVTKGYYELAIAGLRSTAQTREVDVAEKFGLFINNRNSIDALSERTNAAFFDQYKYTRDKDDEIRDKISALEVKVAKAEAIRPYQDELILCKINDVAKDAAYNLWKRTCRMIEGVNTLPLTPEVTGVLSQTCCNQQLLAALAGAGGGA